MKLKTIRSVGLALALAVVLTACGGTQPAQAPAPAAPAPAAPAAQPAAPTVAATPAAAAATYDKLMVFFDTVRGSKNVPEQEKPNKSCVLNNKFLRNEEVVWRVKVVDPKTGKGLDDQQLESIQVKLADGTEVNTKFGKRPSKEPTDEFWAGGWVIPENYPTGTLNFQIVVKAKDGRAADKPLTINTATTNLFVLDAKVPIIPPAPAKQG